MKYKLLCTDMDGTLLNDNKEISERNKNAIKLANEKGLKIVVCTGRMFNSANFYADMIEVKTPIISANGAFIREKDRNEVIYKNILGKENCKAILKILKKHGIYINFHSPNSIFSNKMAYSTKIYSDMNKFLPKDSQIDINIVTDWEEVFEKHEDSIVKCIAIDENLEKIKEAKKEMLELEGVEVVSSYDNNFEIMAKGVSKGRGVEILAGFYNLKPEEIICIGDNENDLSMIEYAGLGVAMGNGSEEVKNKADYVTDSNNEDGVAKVIEKFVLNKM